MSFRLEINQLNLHQNLFFMKEYPSCALIATTYNWPEALELLLLSVLNQTVFPNEVIIADDGSREDTKQLIDDFKKKFPVSLIHVWHEDNGFRLATIRNKAIASAQSDYIIQIDGDIIINKNFIKDHLTHAQKNQFLFGSRVNIKQAFLQELFILKKIHFNFFSKGIKKRFRTIRIPFYTNFIKQNHVISSKLRGCNMSFWKNDIIKINGYNEKFIGWGCDDYELGYRLHNSGTAGRRLKFAGIEYHIFHPEASKSNTTNNEIIQRETFEKKIFFINDGINKYLP
jgi:glycosyltransferase involved in cell wall biosynthesis